MIYCLEASIGSIILLSTSPLYVTSLNLSGCAFSQVWHCVLFSRISFCASMLEDVILQLTLPLQKAVL